MHILLHRCEGVVWRLQHLDGFQPTICPKRPPMELLRRNSLHRPVDHVNFRRLSPQDEYHLGRQRMGYLPFIFLLGWKANGCAL